MFQRELGPREYLCAALFSLTLLLPDRAEAQTTTQLWINATFDWVKTDRLTYSLDLEPKVLLSAPPDQPGWRNLDVTPSIEYSATRWMDVVGDLITGRTHQTDDVSTTELTLRGGLRFHLFSRQERPIFREHPSKRRLVIRDLVRWEWRNFFYSNDQPTDSTGRLRNRLELLYPINRSNLTADGTIHAIADWEWFIPFGDPSERFANRRRLRLGVGYRRNRAWRYTALYMRTRSRDTTDEPFTTSENIFNFQVKRVW